jgi:competence ComEA-like helix-hairpin-helix protein
MIAGVVTRARRSIPSGLGVLSPAAVAASAILACAVVLTDAPTAVRAVVVAWFTLAGPGGAIVPLLGLSDRVAELMLCLAVSLALDLGVACGLAYAGAWSPSAAIVVLAAFALAGAWHRASRADTADPHGVRRVHDDGAVLRPGAGGTPISLNSATVEQLDTIAGIGPGTARNIIDWRTRHGGFRSVADLGQVPGIGPKKLAELRDKVQP